MPSQSPVLKNGTLCYSDTRVDAGMKQASTVAIGQNSESGCRYTTKMAVKEIQTDPRKGVVIIKSRSRLGLEL